MPEADPEFPIKLIQFMVENGAEVLSEHVAYSDKEESNEIFYKKTEVNLKDLPVEERAIVVRKQDISWVDEADCVVALVNSPSLGVGMEIQRALDKEKLGMKKTPILCLVKNEMLDKLSFMIRGINIEESEVFQLKTYQGLEEAQGHIFDFLGKNRL